jgi:hypothetical protein
MKKKSIIVALTFVFTFIANLLYAQTNSTDIKIYVYEDEKKPSKFMGDEGLVTIDYMENITQIKILFISKSGNTYNIKTIENKSDNENVIIDNLQLRNNIDNIKNGKFLIVLTDKNNNTFKYKTKSLNKKNDIVKGLTYHVGIYIYDLIAYEIK